MIRPKILASLLQPVGYLEFLKERQDRSLRHDTPLDSGKARGRVFRQTFCLRLTGFRGCAEQRARVSQQDRPRAEAHFQHLVRQEGALLYCDQPLDVGEGIAEPRAQSRIARKRITQALLFGNLGREE